MIFVTVGSHPTYQFQRLIDAVGRLPAQDLVVQYGPASAPRAAAEARPWMSFTEMLGYMERASVIVSHVGVGTVLCAGNMGHVPVVVPRRKQFGETVDDHQVELAVVLERAGRVSVAWDTAELTELVRVVPPRGTHRHPAEHHTLHDAVRAALTPS